MHVRFIPFFIPPPPKVILMSKPGHAEGSLTPVQELFTTINSLTLF